MLSNRIRKLIEPYLQMEIPQMYWKYINVMLNEAYYYTKNGKKYIALPPVPTHYVNYISLLFDPINGACVDIEGWEYVKQKGERI